MKHGKIIMLEICQGLLGIQKRKMARQNREQKLINVSFTNKVKVATARGTVHGECRHGETNANITEQKKRNRV
jgi:hypothetical protein